MYSEQTESPLVIVSGMGYFDIVSLLIQRGADVNCWGPVSLVFLNFLINCDSQIETPLSRACENGYLSVVALLIQHGANVNRLTRVSSTQYLQFSPSIVWRKLTD